MNPNDMQLEVRYLKDKLTDQLFLQCGIELEELVFNSEKLDIENDPDYKQMCDEYGEIMDQL